MDKNYIHKIDKSEIPTCDIMGVKIATINMKWLVEFINDNLNELKGDYICVSNVHTTVMAYECQEYMNVQNGAAIAIPDGGPLSSVGRIRGYSNMSRTTGPDLMEEMFKISAKKGYKHFFFGGNKKNFR